LKELPLRTGAHVVSNEFEAEVEANARELHDDFEEPGVDVSRA
jgi:hypothetical protein